LNIFLAALTTPSTKDFFVRRALGGGAVVPVAAGFFSGEDMAGRLEVFFLADMGAGFSFITAIP
jgi:hypothetical protein